MKPSIIVGIVVVVAIGVLAWLFTPVAGVLMPPSSGMGTPQEPVACTLDAKICPDGTAVGRVGPNCEFAACPVGGQPSTERPTDMATDSVTIGQTIHLSGIDITPLRIVEDSRCPADANCIWEGRLQVEVHMKSYVDERTAVIDMQTPVVTESGRVTLVDVLPVPIAGVEIPLGDYQFTFRVTKS